MSLATGVRLGPYEILGPIGAGGMGEVYRARDPRLGREVAVKVLPAALAADADRQRRFEQEARSAGRLNHPNIIHIYDVGQHEGQPYLVTELLEGETLRARMGGSPLPVRKAIEVAIPIAYGLAAAHEAGIVHRDLKPENLFITKDGRVKILDFGLAKLTRPDAADGGQSAARTVAADTGKGQVWGTAGYMSPEQARGQQVDHRSDIFSFGSILYEMLAGARAFRGESPADTMSAILHEDPPDLTTLDKEIPLVLQRIVHHCLEKSPGERFRSAHDLAFQLEGISGLSGSSAIEAVPRGAVAGAAPPSAATFRQLSYQRGYLHTARFAADGETVVYGAEWEGDCVRIYMKRPESPDAIPLALPSADISAISRTGEIAISMDHSYAHNGVAHGTLALALLFGGAPREIEEKVLQVDFAPDGKSMVVARDVGGKGRIEFPLGKVLYETTGHVTFPRMSPSGDLIAFFDHPFPNDDRGMVAILDLEGKKTTLTEEWASAQGLAWSSSGEEIWFSAAASGSHRALYAVKPTGEQRLVSGFPGGVRLFDISKSGRVLLTRDSVRLGMYCKAPGETEERELSWLDWSLTCELSKDGSMLLFDEESEHVGANYVTCIRKTDGSPVVRLGEGKALSLSPDARWAVAKLPVQASPLIVYPTGAGQKRILSTGAANVPNVRWLPDGRTLFCIGREKGRALAMLMDSERGDTTVLATDWPDTWSGSAVSPDGRIAAVGFLDGTSILLRLEGGECRPGPALEPRERIIAFSLDGKRLFVEKQGQTLRVDQVHIETGAHTPWKTLRPPDPSGVSLMFGTRLVLDGEAYVYGYARVLSDLYVAEGLV